MFFFFGSNCHISSSIVWSTDKKTHISIIYQQTTLSNALEYVPSDEISFMYTMGNWLFLGNAQAMQWSTWQFCLSPKWSSSSDLPLKTKPQASSRTNASLVSPQGLGSALKNSRFEKLQGGARTFVGGYVILGTQDLWWGQQFHLIQVDYESTRN